MLYRAGYAFEKCDWQWLCTSERNSIEMQAFHSSARVLRQAIVGEHLDAEELAALKSTEVGAQVFQVAVRLVGCLLRTVAACVLQSVTHRLLGVMKLRSKEKGQASTFRTRSALRRSCSGWEWQVW